MGKPDTGSKKIVNIYNQAWAEWVLQQQQIKVEAELSGEFQFVAKATDSLLQVSDAQGRFLVLTELQFQYDPKMPKRLAAYAALARQKYDMDVYVAVVYFLPPAADVTIDKSYSREFMGQAAHQDFYPILLWELEAEQVLAHDNPALLPFVPLMQGGNTEQMVRRCAERIRQEPEAAELETILALFAEHVLDRNLIRQILRWEMQMVQRSSILSELIQEGFEKGLEEGLEKGERKATLEVLQEALETHFKVESSIFDEQFEQLDIASLKKLNKTVWTVQTLKEFEEVLADMLSKLSSPQSSNS